MLWFFPQKWLGSFYEHSIPIGLDFGFFSGLRMLACVMNLSARIECLAFLLVLLAPLACNGLYFHISETERKCFIEEVPEETLLKG